MAKITVTAALQEGNWSAAPWAPRLPDETAFQTWVESLIDRAAAYVRWRTGSEHYDSEEEPQAAVLAEAEMHICQEQLLLSAAVVADAASGLAAPPFQASGMDLRFQARERRLRAEELLVPYDQGRLRQATRPGATSSALGTLRRRDRRYDEMEGPQLGE